MIALLLTTLAAFAQDDGYRIGPGDKLQINIHRVQIDVTEFQVSEAGEISFPYVGRVKVAGLSPFEAEEYMIDLLKDGYIRDPEVTISVSTHSGHRVELIGSVEKTGIYPLSRATTIRALMATAGGAKEGSTIYVKRGESEQHIIGISEMDTAAGDFILQGGDVITVIAGERVYLAGEVAKEGSLPYRRGMTASQAILEIGGFGKFARRNAAYIIRDGEKIKIKLNKIIKGRKSDIPLKPGDRIIVPVNPL